MGSWLDQELGGDAKQRRDEIRLLVSPFATHLALPLRIMFTASIPCIVRHAVTNEP